jgi:glycosyltransferase involved in cell wall biosynthesis
MSASPLISIVVPSYNQGSYLEQTLLSILAQAHPSLELIVMDGGSSDQSVDIIRRYEGRLAYWQSQADGGQAAAIKAGFERSHGQILGWLNSDDVYLPGALQAVAERFAAEPGALALSGGAYFIDTEGRPTRFGRLGFTLGVAATYDRLRYYDSDGVYQPATFYRREAYEACGGVDPSFQFSMDRDLLTRIAKQGRIARLPRFLAGARVHPDTKTLNLRAVCLAENERIMRAQGAFEAPRWRQRLRYWRHALPNLWRKAGCLFLQKAGSLPMARAHYEPGAPS